MDKKYGSIRLLTGNANIPLAKDIAKYLEIELSDAEVTKFSDGEIALNIAESVRGEDVFLIQSTSSPCNDNIMELLIMLDALRRASAGRVTAVIPYYGYARQDRKAKSRDPITAKLIANILTVAGADRILTMDLHSNQIQGFFDIPLDHLTGNQIITDYFMEKNLKDLCFVSPDAGSAKRTRKIARNFNAPFAIIDKNRPKPNVSEVMNVIGDVKGKNCLLFDDMIDTAGTITSGAEALLKMGAKDVWAACTHGVLSGPAVERIAASPIKELVTLDTIDVPQEKRIDKIKILSSGAFFGRAIEYIHYGRSLSKLFAGSYS